MYRHGGPVVKATHTEAQSNANLYSSCLHVMDLWHIFTFPCLEPCIILHCGVSGYFLLKWMQTIGASLWGKIALRFERHKQQLFDSGPPMDCSGTHSVQPRSGFFSFFFFERLKLQIDKVQ